MREGATPRADGVMKYLLVPGNNSLSHLAKALAIRAELVERGHQVLVAATAGNARFLAGRDVAHAVLPDLQEADDGGFPSVEWFRRPKRIAETILAELRLLEAFRPDRVLGLFRFTSKAAATLAGIPFDSLICGCMLPEFSAPLGYAADEPGGFPQQEFMSVFFRYAGLRLSQGLALLGLPPVADSRRMLVGERTFLWDFPEFLPLPPPADAIPIGPVTWQGWPYDQRDWETVRSGGRRLAVVSFGTCAGNMDGALRLTRLLGDLGYHVLLTAASRLQLDDRLRNAAWLTRCEFAPLHRLFPHASLLVSHGGQMSLFEALAHRVPVAVLPLQPEQAHNGVCMERLGCGLRLVAGQPFLGDSGVYLNALAEKKDQELAETITALTTQADGAKLAAGAAMLARYRGVADLVPHLEAGHV